MRLVDALELEAGLFATKWNALYYAPLRGVICSDLHLGYERALVARGVAFPGGQFEALVEKFSALFKAFQVDTVVLNGDVKHEFGKGSFVQGQEVRKLLAFLSGKCSQVVVVKGNHDSYLEALCEGFPKVNVFDDHFVLGKLFITHGALSVKGYARKTLVMGHQHPSIVLRDEVGAQLKLPCFLWKKGVVVTPAFSTLSAGVDSLREKASGFLGRVLEKEGLGSFTPVAVSGEGVFTLPRLSKLQKLQAKSLYFESD